MRCLNEPIARMANAEDHCTGRFWEGRFKSQALLDAPAVLACMAYVDLNPIRAAMAKTPEESNYTSIQERILHPETSCLRQCAEPGDEGIPFGFQDYLELVECITGTRLSGQGRSTHIFCTRVSEYAEEICTVARAMFCKRPGSWKATLARKGITGRSKSKTRTFDLFPIGQ
jgi:hypothetical protein